MSMDQNRIDALGAAIVAASKVTAPSDTRTLTEEDLRKIISALSQAFTLGSETNARFNNLAAALRASLASIPQTPKEGER